MDDNGRAPGAVRAERAPERTPVRYDRRRERVPVRTILATIGLVVGTVLLLLIVRQTARVLIWIGIAGFFAVALFPVVNWVDDHLRRCPRSLATLLVFLAALSVLIGIIAGFAIPLAHESGHLVAGVQTMIADARAGRGPTGDLLERLHADQWVKDHEADLKKAAGGLGTPALGFVRGAAGGLVAVVTIFTLSFLMVLQGRKLVENAVALFKPQHRERARKVGTGCAKVITGYIAGNALISVICGTLTYIVLKVTGVPFAGIIALFVGIADLIPLIGATLGAVVAGLAGFLHSTTAGIAVLVFFLVYQQVENHLLQPVIMSRTVQLNPLVVLISILIFVELAGILGALLAVPLAGIGQVVLRDWWEHRGGPEPDPEPDRADVRSSAPEAPMSRPTMTG
jgi:predicted PurR-regulated permease PerM